MPATRPSYSAYSACHMGAARATPPDREPQTGHQELDTGPVAAHKTSKNSSVYLDLVDSLGPRSTCLLRAVRWLWLRPAMRLGPAMFRSASLGRRTFR
jgi:hypothetical protein